MNLKVWICMKGKSEMSYYNSVKFSFVYFITNYIDSRNIDKLLTKHTWRYIVKYVNHCSIIFFKHHLPWKCNNEMIYGIPPQLSRKWGKNVTHKVFSENHHHDKKIPIFTVICCSSFLCLLRDTKTFFTCTFFFTRRAQLSNKVIFCNKVPKNLLRCWRKY